MRYLRTNTAIRVTVGPFFDKTDGVTPEVAITVTSCKLTLMVDDANVPTLVLDVAPTASGGANDMVHVTGDDAGFYDLELAAANVNYLGRAMLAITDAAVHCPVFHEFMILPAMVYDALVLGTDDLDTNTKKWNDLTTVALPLIPTTAGRTLDVSATGEAGVDWANVGSPTTTLGLSGTTIKAVTDAVADSAGITTLLSRIPSGLFTGITSLAQWLGLMAGKQTGNSTARTEVRATGGGSGTYDETTDSQEAVRDNMGTAQTGDSFARLGAAGAGLTSILEKLSPLATKTGSVNDAGASATVFITDLTESANDYWKDAYVRLTSGALVNQVKKITAYNGTTKAITVLGGFTAAPANGVTFEIVND